MCNRLISYIDYISQIKHEQTMKKITVLIRKCSYVH